MSLLVCDRIEGEFAVLVDQNGTARPIPLARFDRTVKEGDVFDENLIYDPVETAARRARISHLFRKLKKKGE